MDKYVILPSNSSMNYFPDNTLSNFKVKLGKPLRLSGRHEVALVEIIYPHLHLSVEPQEAWIAMLQRSGTDASYVTSDIAVNHKRLGIEYLDAGLYSSHDQILAAMESKLIKYDISIKFKTARNRFAIAGLGIGVKCQGITMSPKFAKILGFAAGAADSYTFSTNAEASNMPDYTGGEHALFIYSSIVEHQIIGDVLAPLLRVVCPEAKNLGNTITSEKYIKPYYMEVSRSFIDVIDIQIRTTTGKLYPFVSGSPVILKLHFRAVHS